MRNEYYIASCPFCGCVGTQIYDVERDKYRYGCVTTQCMGNAYTQTQAFESDIEALQHWNKRQPIDDMVSEVEELVNLAEQRYHAGTSPHALSEHKAYVSVIGIINRVRRYGKKSV